MVWQIDFLHTRVGEQWWCNLPAGIVARKLMHARELLDTPRELPFETSHAPSKNILFRPNPSRENESSATCAHVS